MASEVTPSHSAAAACNGSVEVFPWLKTLPVAPEYHPTLAEFQDPIAYIFKIEKEASQYGICKIVPPVCPNPKKTALSNLNKSLIARSGSSSTFTTRQQQIGFCPRKHRPVQKPVWQSGENYTVQEFEAKAKVFEKNYLKKCTKKCLTPLDIETLYWKATADKPFSVEYANDMPGSAFALKKGGREGGLGEGSLNSNMSVGETDWNMRGVARAKGSLLTFMKEEIPGVTSPMLYIAMMFSWFAWHVEDHDLHSLNYLHMGAGKTWYGVPRDAAVAFEEVIRVQGYGGESNPLVTFDTLGEKTTVMSPEVLVDAGVPCCRLVQNAGEFVVTFPRAYHSGFSHGFNCAEASNIATPEWLRFAKDAAIRRASINSPPMVSHFQLLYDLALSFCSRKPKGTCLEPRSSRLKDKKKGEGEMLVKQVFVQDVMQNNDLMHMLAEQPSVVIIPQYSVGSSFYLSLKGRTKLQADSRLSSSLCSSDLMMSSTNGLASVDDGILRAQGFLEDTGDFMKGKFISTTIGKKLLSAGDAFGLASQFKNVKNEKERALRGDRMNDQGLFSCVTCGILCFSCVAVIQPTDTASDYLSTADCSALQNWEETNNHCIGTSVSWDGNFPESGWANDRNLVGLFDVPLKSGDQVESLRDQSGAVSKPEAQKRTSSLGLLALTYGNSSDSEDEAEGEADCLHESGLHAGLSNLASASYNEISHSGTDCINEISLHHPGPCMDLEQTTYVSSSTRHQSSCEPLDHWEDTCMAARSTCFTKSFQHQKKLQDIASNYSLDSSKAETTVSTSPRFESTIAPYSSRSDEDSSRMHVFCLQHAVQVQQKLRSIGGANILLLCHPDYPNAQAQAKTLAEELGTSYTWNDVSIRTASREDEDTIRSALESQEAIHGNGDWAVKLGIDLFYSANLSRSPLYCKQMPYNFIIYNAFGPSSQAKYSKPEFSAKAKKMAVAGKWCGRVWMSNQVHLYLSETEFDQEHEQEQAKERNFASRVKAEGTQAAVTASGACITGRKRKSAVDIRPVVKAKSAKSETGEDSSGVHSDVPLKSNSRIKKFKKEDVFSRNTSSRSKKLFHSILQDDPESEPEHEPEPEPEPPNTCGRSKRQIDLVTENVPKPTKVFTRKKKDIKVTEEETGPSRISTREKKQLKVDNECEPEGGGPSTRLRQRISKSVKSQGSRSVEAKSVPKKQQVVFTGKKGSTVCKNTKVSNEKAEFTCDIEGCNMGFSSKHDLALHKKNICPVKGCGKKFFSHKYLVQHRRVHVDDRPLKCPWKGCKMTFKWAWARTEHIRVHTGARPYVCSEAGCGQTFRFVSDFSRHKRKTGHSSTKKGR